MSKDKTETSTTTDTLQTWKKIVMSKDVLYRNDAYYVASSGGSRMIIIQVQLKDNNYVEWAKSHAIGFAYKEEIRVRRWNNTYSKR